MQAIRVEHPANGWGMFRQTDESCHVRYNNQGIDLEDLIDRHRKIPTPWYDSLLKTFNDNEFCAFISIEQIQQWIFPEEFEKLFKLGFQVYLLELSDCRVGEYQILYEKQNIKEQKNISSLFKS
jgi:hypothetical protein